MQSDPSRLGPDNASIRHRGHGRKDRAGYEGMLVIPASTCRPATDLLPHQELPDENAQTSLTQESAYEVICRPQPDVLSPSEPGARPLTGCANQINDVKEQNKNDISKPRPRRQ